MQVQRAVLIASVIMKRGFEDAPDEFLVGSEDQPAQKRKRMSRFEGGVTSDPVGNGIPSSQNIQELLASTKKQIEERKKQTQALLAQQKPPTAGLLPTPPSAPPVNMYSVAEHVMSPAMSEAVEKAKKAAEVRIPHSNYNITRGSPPPPPPPLQISHWVPLLYPFLPLKCGLSSQFNVLLSSAVSLRNGRKVLHILGISVY